MAGSPAVLAAGSYAGTTTTSASTFSTAFSTQHHSATVDDWLAKYFGDSGSSGIWVGHGGSGGSTGSGGGTSPGDGTPTGGGGTSSGGGTTSGGSGGSASGGGSSAVQNWLDRFYGGQYTIHFGGSSSTGSNTGNTGGSTGNTGGSTGNTGGSTGNTGGSTGNTGGSTGNTGGSTGNTGGICNPTGELNPATNTQFPSVPSEEQQLLNLINQERAKAGLQTLTPDPTLKRYARMRALDLVVHRMFTHYTPTYGLARKMKNTCGLDRSMAGGGEVLATGPSATHIFYQFMGSPEHKVVIMYPGHRYIGVGIIHGRGATLMASVLFTNN